jgi:hypothetical protein
MQEKHPNAIPAPIQVRKGYWNRRGDHLTESGHIVYVPEGKAFPSDLIHYPIEEFMNPDGEKIQHTSQEELLDSLPRFGKPPRQPYESVSHIFSPLSRLEEYLREFCSLCNMNVDGVH